MLSDTERGSLAIGLKVKIVVQFELSPNQVGFFPLLSEGPPTSSLDQTTHQLRVVSFSNKHFVLCLLRYALQIEAIGKGYLPYEVFVVIPIEWRSEGLYPDFEVIARPLHTMSFFQGLPEANDDLSFALFIEDSRRILYNFKIPRLQRIPSISLVHIPLYLRIDLYEVQFLYIQENCLILRIFASPRLFAMKSSGVDLIRHLNRRQPLPHVVHTVSRVLKFFSSFVGYGLIQGKFSLLVQGSADIDIHAQSINFRALVFVDQFGPIPQAADFLPLPAQLHGLSHALRKLVDLVLKDGQLAWLIDAAMMRLIDQ